MVYKRISTNNSMTGWKFMSWAKSNKDNLKLLASVLLGLLATTLDGNVLIQALFGGAATAGTKIVLDTIDFFLSEVQLE